MNKYIPLILILLFIMPVSVSAIDLGCIFWPEYCLMHEFQNITATLDQLATDYKGYNTVSYSIYAQDGQTLLLDLRSTDELYSPDVYMIIISSFAPHEGISPNPGDSINIACSNINRTYYLDSQMTWTTVYMANIHIPLNSGYSQGAFYSIEETSHTKYSNLCYVTMHGNDAMLEIHYRPMIQSPLSKAFQIPDEATNEIIQRTGHTLTAAFDVIKLVIIAAGLVLLIFIIVFMAKVFMFFVKKLKVRKQ
jgi:hypothetical protein